ncbi:MAG: HAD hydrolase family protein, partial [Anaerolineae bacterium]|nr:HAD hydrolase family protein [Anaerolineae bacterium]
MTQSPDKKPDIRVVVLDVDGTVLDSNHALTPRAAETLKTAIAKGVQVVLATGKTRYSTTRLVDELGIRAYTGPSYRNVVMYSLDDGRLDYDWNDERGERGFRAALEFAEQHD